MIVTYKNVDITKIVNIQSCVVNDTTGKSDRIDITFDNPNEWYRWNPTEDDPISIAHNGYSSGVMYVNTIIPEDGKFRIIASSLPCSARNKNNQSFKDMTIGQILTTCAAQSNMGFQVYGIDTDIMIPYIERNNEGNAAFLQRFLTLEGATLKCINGYYIVIGIEEIQNKTASQIIMLDAKRYGIKHVKNGMKYKGLTIQSVYGSGTVFDTEVQEAHTHLIMDNMPVLDNIQAKRWAKNKLLDLNRKTETLRFDTMFNPKLTSMIRIDIIDSDYLSGEWIVDEVTHDIIENRTSYTMMRCIDSIK